MAADSPRSFSRVIRLDADYLRIVINQNEIFILPSELLDWRGGFSSSKSNKLNASIYLWLIFCLNENKDSSRGKAEIRNCIDYHYYRAINFIQHFDGDYEFDFVRHTQHNQNAFEWITFDVHIGERCRRRCFRAQP